MSGEPAWRGLSLGAGVQSSALLLLGAEGRLGRVDAAIFANTQWEHKATYAHLERLIREVAEPAGIPVYLVTAGNIRADALDPAHRFASMPLFIYGPPITVRDPLETADCGCAWTNLDSDDLIENGGSIPTPPACVRCGNTGSFVTRWGEERTERTLGMGRRQCSAEYKLKPIKRKVRELLGYPHPTPVPKGVFAETLIGFSRDEIGRVRDSDVKYMRSVFPLLDLDGAADGRKGWTRADCLRYLRKHGFGETPKSACIGCPFHGNAQWRDLRDNHPDEWADAVDFDAAIRAGHANANAKGQPLLGTAYLHRSRVPLDQAPIDRVTDHEWRGMQGDLLQIAAENEDGDPDGCSPWGCRSGVPAASP